MKTLLIAILCWVPLLTWAKSPLEPLQISERFVAPDGWRQMPDYLCCEVEQQAKGQTLGQQIPARLQRSCQLVQQGPATAVVAVELRDSVARDDIYLHFSKHPDGWKLQAVRRLGMRQLGPPMLELLTAMPPAEVAHYDAKHPDAKHQFAVGNIQLWLSTDADITQHFNRRQADFQQVLRLLQARRYFNAPPDSLPAAEQAANKDPDVQAMLRNLFISRVTRHDTGCGTCIEFLIGGTADDAVGLLYQPDAAAVPAMTPDHLIVLRPLSNGWYLYKTT